MSACPSVATIARLATDSFQGQVPVLLEQHVEGCQACQLKLERLRRNDLETDGSSPPLPFPDQPPQIPGFAIERELGRGGTGVVYQAFQTSLNRPVALKVVRSGAASGSREHARWLREARAFSRVRHPNVVPLYEVGEADGWLYLVLEFVPGGTLEERLKVPYAPGDAARSLETIARAVEEIHRAGLLHLDLKPSNILLDGPPEAPREVSIPRVADFSIAHRWDDPDASLSMASLAGPIGTPSYMAPEQVTGHRPSIGPATDVYGLGALLYHMLTGRPVFSAASVAETLEQVRHQDPVPPRRLNPSIPRDLETICLKCLKKAPARRYPTAEALADDLHLYQEGSPITARPVSIAERIWRDCQRRPAVATLAGSLVITLCVGFLGMFLLWRRAEFERAHAENQSIRAETALAQSRSDVQVTKNVVNQIIDVTTGGKEGFARTLDANEYIELLRKIRKLRRALADRDSEGRTIGSLPLSMDFRLADALVLDHQWAAARVVFEESITDLEAILRRDPANCQALDWLQESLARLAEVAGQEKKPDESIRLLRRAVLVSKEFCRLQASADPIYALAYDRERLAFMLAKRGELTEARDLLRENRSRFPAVPNQWVGIRFQCWRVRVQSDFLRMIEVASSESPTTSSNAEMVPRDPLSRLASREADRFSPRIWAETASDALRPPALANEDPHSHCEAGVILCSFLSGTASQLRHLRKFDEARRVADRMLELARLLVEEYPNRPDVHLALGDAYNEFSKHAWRPPEAWDAIESNLIKAIDATKQALELNPDDSRARFFLEQRRERLAKALKDKLARERTKPTERPASSVGS